MPNTRLIFILIVILTQSCTSTQLFYKTDGLDSEMSTIIIDRETQFVGGGIDAYILDELPNHEPNSLVGSVNGLEIMGGDWTGASLYIYYPDKNSKAITLVDKKHRKWTYSDTWISPTIETLIEGKTDFKIVKESYSEFISQMRKYPRVTLQYPVTKYGQYGRKWEEEMTINLYGATTIGMVGNGDQLTWKRPPGKAVITVFMRSFAYESMTSHTFNLEAGKTYKLALHKSIGSLDGGCPVLELVK